MSNNWHRQSTTNDQHPTPNNQLLKQETNNKHRQLNPTINSGTRKPTINNQQPTTCTDRCTQRTTQVPYNRQGWKLKYTFQRFWLKFTKNCPDISIFKRKVLRKKSSYSFCFCQKYQQFSFHCSQSWYRQYHCTSLIDNEQHYQLKTWTHIDKSTRPIISTNWEPITDSGDL